MIWLRQSSVRAGTYRYGNVAYNFSKKESGPWMHATYPKKRALWFLFPSDLPELRWAGCLFFEAKKPSYFDERRAPENKTKERNGSAATHRSAKWCSAGRWVSTFYLVPWVAVCRLFNRCHTMVIELSFATHGTVTFLRSDRPSSSSTTACCKEGISSIISSIPCLL